MVKPIEVKNLSKTFRHPMRVWDLIEAVKNHNREPVDKLIALIRKTTDDFTGLPVPVIAAISGRAYGGGAELAARCEIGRAHV